MSDDGKVILVVADKQEYDLADFEFEEDVLVGDS